MKVNSGSRSIGKKINQLFVGAACIAFPITLIIACILLRVDGNNNEFRTVERIKALLDAQLPLLASDLSRGNSKTMIPRLDVLVATHSPNGMEAAIFDRGGNKLTASDGFDGVFGKFKSPMKTGEYVTSEGYAVSIKPIRSGVETLGTAAFAVKLQPQSSKLIGQSLAASLLILSLVLSVLFIATRRYLMRTIVYPIEKLIDELPALSKFVENPNEPLPKAPAFDSEEMKSLSEALWKTHDQLKNTLQKEESLRRLTAEKEVSLRISKQVAHDIRSPLSALDVTVETMQNVEENKRLLIRRVVSRIRDITNNLRRAGATSSLACTSSKESPELLSGILELLISEKRAEFAKRSGLEIELFILEGAHGIFSQVASCDLQRILSNLINNSAEAIESDKGYIRVVLSRQNNSALIRILDNGKGIPHDVLEKLGEGEHSFGKEEGSGQGIFPAKSTIELWRGNLSIGSEVGQGTCIEIRLPIVSPPSWFVDTIVIPDTVAILDDDPTIHGVWDERLRDTGLSNRAEVVHFYDAQSFENWCRHSAGRNALFLMDYELIGQKESGLDVIERLGIAQESILITSHYDEPSVLTRCLASKVRLIPKAIAGFIPIRKEAIADVIQLHLGLEPGLA